jgi:hypothetical protein
MQQTMIKAYLSVVAAVTKCLLASDLCEAQKKICEAQHSIARLLCVQHWQTCDERTLVARFVLSVSMLASSLVVSVTRKSVSDDNWRLVCYVWRSGNLVWHHT